MTRSAPSSANYSAVARPIPNAAPVTNRLPVHPSRSDPCGASPRSRAQERRLGDGRRLRLGLHARAIDSSQRPTTPRMLLALGDRPVDVDADPPRSASLKSSMVWRVPSTNERQPIWPTA